MNGYVHCTPLSIKNCGRRLVSWLGLPIKLGYPQTPWFRKSVFPIKCSDTLTCTRLTSSDCSVCLAIHFGSTAISSCARCRHGAWMVHEQRTTPVVCNFSFLFCCFFVFLLFGSLCFDVSLGSSFLLCCFPLFCFFAFLFFCRFAFLPA